MLAWKAVLSQALRLGVTDRLRLPGFVPSASQCLPAFDLFLNTSRYEGLSIATLEALAHEALDPTPLVTTRITLDELPHAFDALKHPTTDCKVIVHP